MQNRVWFVVGSMALLVIAMCHEILQLRAKNLRLGVFLAVEQTRREMITKYGASIRLGASERLTRASSDPRREYH